jgi:hypothetical protein
MWVNLHCGLIVRRIRSTRKNCSAASLGAGGMTPVCLRVPFREVGIKSQRPALTRSTAMGSKMTKEHTFDRRVTTRAEREAREAFRANEAKKALTDYEKAQKEFHLNRERLKAERLGREAEAIRQLSAKVR